tara:strand:- start:2416 stop:2628 length:213 start_codon:yes stop_codon:yes gene_type:complete
MPAIMIRKHQFVMGKQFLIRHCSEKFGFGRDPVCRPATGSGLIRDITMHFDYNRRVNFNCFEINNKETLK